MGAHDLTHPESLSENQLREILKNSCIENQKFERLCKSELVEMYKRIAMPLPQRCHRNANNLDAKADDVSENFTSDNHTHSLTTDLNKGNKRMCQSHLQTTSDQLKSSFNDQTLMHKKIRMHSAPKVDNVYNGIGKRRCNEQNEELLTKKRQKITWP